MHLFHLHPPADPPDLANQPRLLGSSPVVSSPRHVLRADVLAEVGQVQWMIRPTDQLTDVTPDLTHPTTKKSWIASSLQCSSFPASSCRRTSFRTRACASAYRSSGVPRSLASILLEASVPPPIYLIHGKAGETANGFDVLGFDARLMT
jgi:hypothetical protein